MRHAPWKRRYVSSLRRYLTSWSRRSLSRCGLLDHILCEWQAVSQALFWVSVGGWGIILGGCGWVVVGGALFWEVRVGGKIFWVGGGGWGWVGVGALFHNAHILPTLLQIYLFYFIFSSFFIINGRKFELTSILLPYGPKKSSELASVWIIRVPIKWHKI